MKKPLQLFGCCTILLTSCVVGPTYEKPEITRVAPTDWRWKLAEPKDAVPKGNWWNVFQDPVLTALETNAVANNQSLRAAVARVDQARAAARLTRAQFFPELSLDPSYTRQRVSANEPLPFPVKLKPVYLNTFNVPLDLSYEVDLWGRVRHSFDAARAQAEGTAADFENVALTLTADVAVNYFLLRSLDAEIATLRQTVVLREDSVRILQARFTAGTVPELDAVQAQGDLATVQADLADTLRQRAETTDALALLCGKSASSFTVDPAPLAENPPRVPIGVPSEVLERRPDIASAERNLAAKNAQIGIARAAYYPVVRLTGEAGFLSGEARNLFDMNSLAFSVGPSVSLPLFTGGRTAAEVKQSQGAYQEATATYQQAVLAAIKEVEDSLAQINYWNDQATALASALTASRRATELIKARYTAGVITQFEVLGTQRLELQQERQITQLTARRFAATVRLIKALGGSWDPGTAAKP